MKGRANRTIKQKEHGAGGREVWSVPFREAYRLVVFDPKRGHIVSFLPEPKSPAAPSQKGRP